MKTSLLFAAVKLALWACVAAISSNPWAAKAAPGDEHWDPQFGWAGPGNNNYAVAMHNGRTYVCGTVLSTNVALEVWDGAQWSALSQIYGSLPALVYDMAFLGDTLYVAGLFTNVDGVAVTNFAKWDGTNWSSVGLSKGTAYVLAVDGVNLYVGGAFTNLAGVAMKNIGRWDGSVWRALGAGLGDTNLTYVYALAVTNGVVYAGGTFTNSGSSLVCSNVARWDGANWSALGGGLSSTVNSLALKGGELYAGGLFGSSPASALAKWDGGSWSLCGSGFTVAAQSIGVLGNAVCATGSFTSGGGTSAARFAVWSGTSWAAAGSGLSSYGNRVYSTGTNVYVGGNFTLAGGQLANGLAVWDGANWSVIGAAGRTNGLLSSVTALASDGANLYAGGSFTVAGETPANYIARFDGTKWNAMGTGLSGSSTPSVRAIAIDGSDVYVGGLFTGAGGVSVQNIARWDGSGWHTMGSPGGMVGSITVRPDGVYAVGASYNGSVYGSWFCARWDGASWHPVLSFNQDDTLTLFYLNDSVMGMAAAAFVGSDLYVGGHFKITWYDPTFTIFIDSPNILRFDGSYGRIVGTGVNSNVVAMAAVGNDLYVAGPFTSAGGVAANHIARWGGSSWSDVGGGQVGNGSVYALATDGTSLYASGSFTNMGGVAANRIAKWDGANWCALGSGVVIPGSSSGSASAVAASGDDVYTGGSFRMAGGKTSLYLGHWNQQVNFHTPQLINPAWLPGAQFRTRLVGVAGVTNVVEATTNFDSWTPVLTNSAGIYDFKDAAASNYRHRFYRAVLRQ